MAKITVEFDTIEKTARFMNDNKILENIYSASFYGYGDGKFACSIYSAEYDEDNKINHTYGLAASEAEIKENEAKVSEAGLKFLNSYTR